MPHRRFLKRQSARVMGHARASNPARMCLGLDPEAGESPKILFDDAGVRSRREREIRPRPSRLADSCLLICAGEIMVVNVLASLPCVCISNLSLSLKLPA